MIEKHYLQFMDADKRVHEVQVPSMFQGLGCFSGTMPFGGKYVMTYCLPDGTKPMIAMPDDYAPEKNWYYCGYRRDPAE